jgi:hypothetical protein
MYHPRPAHHVVRAIYVWGEKGGVKGNN